MDSVDVVPLTFSESKPLFDLFFALKNLGSGFDSRVGICKNADV